MARRRAVKDRRWSRYLMDRQYGEQVGLEKLRQRHAMQVQSEADLRAAERLEETGRQREEEGFRERRAKRELATTKQKTEAAETQQEQEQLQPYREAAKQQLPPEQHAAVDAATTFAEIGSILDDYRAERTETRITATGETTELRRQAQERLGEWRRSNLAGANQTMLDRAEDLAFSEYMKQYTGGLLYGEGIQRDTPEAQTYIAEHAKKFLEQLKRSRAAALAGTTKAEAAPPKGPEGKIHVRWKATGETGWVTPAHFDEETMEELEAETK